MSKVEDKLDLILEKISKMEGQQEYIVGRLDKNIELNQEVILLAEKNRVTEERVKSIENKIESVNGLYGKINYRFGVMSGGCAVFTFIINLII